MQQCRPPSLCPWCSDAGGGGSHTCRDNPSCGESAPEIVRTLPRRALPKYKPTTQSMSHNHSLHI